MSDEWLPLSAREGRPRVDYSALHEGVPEWLRGSLIDWITREFKRQADPRSRYSRDMLRQTERRFRIMLAWQDGESSAYDTLLLWALGNDEYLLDLADFVLHGFTLNRSSVVYEVGQIDDLAEMLSDAGSAWKLGGTVSETRLERRVDATMTAVVEEVIATHTRASDYLKSGWASVWGRQPNASEGYRDAVRAVEAAICPVVLPNNPKATLGTVIAAIRNKPSKFAVRLHPDAEHGVNAVLRQLDMLWRGQEDRHGNASDPNAPLTVSIDAAQDAVVLAAQIVHWVQAGGFTAT